ncbi:hypothetical protein [Terrihabitans rhizophilus]|uniref:Uncharacterized protein n=1 Tax=Terrihabitans rhizophilus TaxID=3092662 RepID=A0ABU4RLQ2_9HYPH|nr:hypothetical protein [Terrihabitans sp. PJ23]MDX6805754.1 hypothetical protein [Terrihabitans sp. PJ23]
MVPTGIKRLTLGVAAMCAVGAVALPASAASLGAGCVLSGAVSPDINSALRAGSESTLVDLLVGQPSLAADVILAARDAAPRDAEMLAGALASARLELISAGQESGAASIGAAASCADRAFRTAHARGFRRLVAGGTAPGYEVPLFYDNFGGGLASPN